MLGALSKEQSVLIHAGASGVGQLPRFTTDHDMLHDYLFRSSTTQYHLVIG